MALLSALKKFFRFMSSGASDLWFRFNQMLQNDLRFSLILLIGVFVGLTIIPFTVYRLFTHDYFHALINSMIVLSICGVCIYAAKTGRSLGAGKLLVIVVCIAGTITAVYLGWEGFVWIYPGILASMFISTPVFGFVFSMVMVLAIFMVTDHFDSTVQALSSFFTYFLVGVLSLIISWRYTVEHQELEYRAQHDSLTGLKNRYSLEHSLSLVIDRVKEGTFSASLLMVDVDHFKPINDTFGHKVGDDVLRDIAGIIQDSSRRSDDVCRFGGEEFVVTLNDCPAPYAKNIAEKIREDVERRVDCGDFDITVSIGVTGVLSSDTPRELIERCDHNMYEAKNQGRNCCFSDS